MGCGEATPSWTPGNCTFSAPCMGMAPKQGRLRTQFQAICSIERDIFINCLLCFCMLIRRAAVVVQSLSCV